MFARKEKPLPVAVLKPPPTHNTPLTEGEGIHLGEGYYWNPSTLPNSHIVAIGASGSGKTQTLKAISKRSASRCAFSLHQTYPQMQIILLDFHGDQEIVGETCYPIHMASPHGINPLVVNLDPEGGGPNLQAIQIAAILKKSLRLGPNQEGMLIEKHRLRGEIQGRLPHTFLFIDEAKEMPKTEGSACDRIIADGRKFGLSLVLASQSERHLSQDVIGNSASKIVLPVDQTEVKKVSQKFRFSEKKVEALTPLNALCRFGKDAELLEIQPYYQRIKDDR
jgi:hypothetical protein